MFLSLPPATKMFQFAGLPPHALFDSGAGAYTLLHAGFPIRKSAVLRLCAPTRSLSQLVTSFVGSCCQGIRPVLFFA